MDTHSIPELHAIRASLHRQLRQLPAALIDGTLVEIRVRCGEPSCHCAQGERHLKLNLTKKVAGKTHSTYIPQAMAAEVREWVATHKQAKQLLKELAAVSEALIRAHGREQRRQRTTAKGLTLLE